MAWANGGSRTTPLPSDWAQRRQAVRRRARGRCEATEHEPSCNGSGSECDHIDRPDDHGLSNLRWLSTPCHKAKTQAQARAARKTTARPAEAHPGLA